MKNDRKKLLITASTFPRWDGDTEPRFILDYAKEMTKYYQVQVLVPMAPGAQKYENIEGVNVHRFHYFPIRKWETLCYPGAIVPRIKEKKIRILLVPFLLIALKFNLIKYSKRVDIVHAHWIVPQGIMQAGIRKTPFIVTGHGGDVTSLNFEPILFMKRRTLKRAKRITVVSNALEGYIQKYYPNNKTCIIPLGCDTLTFSPENRVDNYFGQGRKKAILFVGRLAEKKGVRYLIEAMKMIDDANLYIVGKGNLEEELRLQARELGDKVTFLGARTHKELAVIYASADVFVAPSITAKDGDKEGFGLVILEAMASGVPVVASESGGITDIISNYENGILCKEKATDEIANAILSIIHDREFCEKIKQNGLCTAMKNGYSEVGKKYYRLLEQVES